MNRDEWMQGDTSSKRIKQLSNMGIYNLIMSGKEEWNKEEDNEVDLVLGSYYKLSKVVGYMIPGKPKIFINTRFFDKRNGKDERFICSNFAHEYIHTLGFRHGGKNYRKSFPYYINKVVEDMAFHNPAFAPKPKTVQVCKRLWYTLWIKKKCYTKVIG